MAGYIAVQTRRGRDATSPIGRQQSHAREAMFHGHERVFTVNVAQRAFDAGSAAAAMALDPALDIELFAAKSELVGEGKGRIRFFPDGSSTGGRIDLELLGDRAAVNVRWSNGLVTVER